VCVCPSLIRVEDQASLGGGGGGGGARKKEREPGKGGAVDYLQVGVRALEYVLLVCVVCVLFVCAQVFECASMREWVCMRARD
jgi:hypothetical protein